MFIHAARLPAGPPPRMSSRSRSRSSSRAARSPRFRRRKRPLQVRASGSDASPISPVSPVSPRMPPVGSPSTPTANGHAAQTPTQSQSSTAPPQKSWATKLSGVYIMVCAYSLDFFFTFFATDGHVFGLAHAAGLPVRRASSRTAAFIVNIVMFFLWGLVHSFTAQPHVQASVIAGARRWLGDAAQKFLFPAPGLVFIVFSALASVPLLCFWQTDDLSAAAPGMLWQLDFPPVQGVRVAASLPAFVTWDFLLRQAVAMLVKTVAMSFISHNIQRIRGIVRPPNSRRAGVGDEAAKKELLSDGWYGVVRHPVYLLLYIMLFVSPSFGWSRLCTVCAFTVYLVPGVWWEERRLESEFGKQRYQAYRQEVPSRFIPYVY